jgi:hypothetical protein
MLALPENFNRKLANCNTIPRNARPEFEIGNTELSAERR